MNRSRVLVVCSLVVVFLLLSALRGTRVRGATETGEPTPPTPETVGERPSFRDGRMVRGDSRQRVLHFTFDDGPRPETTGPLLEHLDTAGVRATFFVVARQLGGRGARRERNVAMVRETLRRGHQVGFHGLDHSAFSELTAPQLTHQFDAGEAAFVRAVGQRPFLVRPPYGRRDVDSDRVVVARHYTQVMWGITAADTSQTTARGVVDAFRSALRRRENGPRVRGGVVLLHDTKPWVIEAFPQLLAEVQARNCALLARGGNEELWDIAPDLTPFFEARQRGDHASMMTRNGGYAPAVQAARQAVLRAETARRCAGAVR